jgi:hypothetical protein
MNKIFMLRHWLFTLLCGPIIFAIINGFNYNWSSKNLFDFFQLYPFTILVGLILSMPTYIFYILISFIFKNKNIKMIYERIVLVIIVIIGVFITTALINGIIWFDLAISYSISSIISGIFFYNVF